MIDFRCHKCNKLLGRYRECRELEIKCPRCGQKNHLREKGLYTAFERGNQLPGAISQTETN
ncbi:MAG: Com family DNA-binding transcriptional regulator [Syntrophomonadaceae bacterium]|nr:Com family DNA-binding transcriptional regulator [Syntrophomonadaceae bacterium]